jgi:PucR C-terminal helix-turn-helix domain/Purine catabolism regulatory protein-like family/GGDEF-like domain
VTFCTLAQIAADPSLRLRVLVQDGSLAQTVRGVHVSDLEHPAQYVLPGELLLTNGLWLGQADPGEWVDELRAAGAVAIGYGVSDFSPTVPDGLIEACRASGVALFEVPADLSFSTIAECIQAHDRSQVATVRLQLTRLRRLLQDLARGEGHAAVLELLRRETRLPIWLVGPGGRSLTADPPPDQRAAQAAARAARRGELPAAITAELSAFGVADALSTTAVIVGAPLAEVSDDARLVIEQAAAYLVIEDARQREHETVRSRMAEELLALVWDGELGTRGLHARVEALGLRPDAELTVLACSNPSRDVAYAALGCRGPCVAASHRGVEILLIQSDEEGTVDEVADLIRDGGEDPVLGTGRTFGGSDGLRRALAESISAHQLARNRPAGERVVRRLEVGSHRLLLDFVDADVLRAYRQSVLGPIEQWDGERGSQLLETLSAFFANDGHWRRTAAQLHIHHNTLHYRLDKIAALTGRSVDSAESRVDFALALAIPRG